MKKKRIFTGFAMLMLAVTLTLGGCGSSSGGSDGGGENGGAAAYSKSADSLADSDRELAENAAGKAESDHSGTGNDATANADGKKKRRKAAKIIYEGNASLETVRFDDTVTTIRKLADQYEAYIVNEYQNEEDSFAGQNKYRNMELTLKIPAEHFQDFLEDLKNKESSDSYVISDKRIQAQDISKAYYDTQGRLEAAKKKLESLQELYEKAKSLQDIIQIQNAINDCQYEIDSLQGTLNNYDEQVAFSTLTLRIDEDTELTVYSRTTGYGNKLVEALKNGFFNGLNFIGGLILFLANSWFVLLIIGLIIFGIVRIIIASDRRSKARREAKQRALQQYGLSRNMPGGVSPVQAGQVNPNPGGVSPVQAGQVSPNPGGANPVQAGQVSPNPGGANPVQAGQVNPNPGGVSPVQAGQVNPNPGGVSPVQAGLVNSNSGDPDQEKPQE